MKFLYFLSSYVHILINAQNIEVLTIKRKHSWRKCVKDNRCFLWFWWLFLSQNNFKSQLCPQRALLQHGFYLSKRESDLQRWTGTSCSIQSETVMELPTVTQSLRAVYEARWSCWLCRLCPWTLLTCWGPRSSAHLPWNKCGMIPRRPETMQKKYRFLVLCISNISSSMILISKDRSFQEMQGCYHLEGQRTRHCLSYDRWT